MRNNSDIWPRDVVILRQTLQHTIHAYHSNRLPTSTDTHIQIYIYIYIYICVCVCGCMCVCTRAGVTGVANRETRCMMLFSDIGKWDCRNVSLWNRCDVADERLQDFGTTQTCARKRVQHRQWMDYIVLETTEMGYVLWEVSLKCCGMYNISCFPSRSQNVKVCWVPHPRTCNIYLSTWETRILKVDSRNF
jgi:hypothetical protein